MALTLRKLNQVLTMTYRSSPDIKSTAASIAALKLAGNRVAAFDCSYRIQNKGISMRLNRRVRMSMISRLPMSRRA